MDMRKYEIGQRLKEIRGTKTLEEFGHQTETFPHILRSMESGRRLPKIKFVLRVTEKFNISPSYILCGDTPIKRRKTNEHPQKN